MKISIILTLILLSILVSPQGTQTSLTNDGYQISKLVPLIQLPHRPHRLQINLHLINKIQNQIPLNLGIHKLLLQHNLLKLQMLLIKTSLHQIKTLNNLPKVQIHNNQILKMLEARLLLKLLLRILVLFKLQKYCWAR